jgi:CHAD domain-containing protein
MHISRHEEIERKYDPGPSTTLPTLTGIGGVSAMGQPVEMELTAVYFDTPDLDLARHGITLRRRAGGEDAGWHLKLPEGRDKRSEVRLPLGRATKTVPARLLTPVRALVRDRPLRPVARVTTRRRCHEVIGANAVVLAEICDDEVHAERLHGPTHVEDWREWEVELVNGSTPLLDAVQQRLLAAGASPGAASSKLGRALGDLVLPAPKAPSRKQLSRGSAAQLVLAHLAEHTEQLRRQDARLRDDLPGSVHKLRIAARRLRSALKTYRALFTSDSAEIVGEELRWLGQVLSQARDAQVMRERLDLLIEAEPAELVLGPVAQHIDDDLRAEYRAGREQALEAIDSKRYFRLLDAIDELVRSSSLTSESHAPAKHLLPGLLHRDTKRLRRAVRRVARADDSHEHDLALHEARKKAKRLRYAAESAIPVFPKKAKKLAVAAKRVQETLGEHQDAVVARLKLREYGAQTHLSGENGFTFGRLHALEQARADDAERRFEDAWDRMPNKLFAHSRRS